MDINNRILFYNIEDQHIPVADEVFVLESKQWQPIWAQNAKKDLQEKIEKGEDKGIHLVRCPGIFSIFKYGYIVKNYRDIRIIPGVDKEFQQVLPVDRAEGTTSLLEKLQPEAVGFIKTPPWSHNGMFKITTGWQCIPPLGVKLMMLPIPYPDSFDFTATIGILDPQINHQINFQMYWNGEINKIITIHKGTPLGYIVPMTERKLNLVTRHQTAVDLKWEKMKNEMYWGKTELNNTISKRKRLHRHAYNEYWFNTKSLDI